MLKYLVLIIISCSSSHSDNLKNNFLALDEGPTEAIADTAGEPEKKFNVNFSKANTIKFKVNNENINFLKQFFLGSLSNEFGHMILEKYL